MRINNLKHKILTNPFVDKVRGELSFDEVAYRDLKSDLEALAVELKGSQTLDRDLALMLYSAPLMLRNIFLSLADGPTPPSRIVSLLEDTWMELDALVTECLAD
ncbi:MAG: hypothetical protein ACPG4T_14445 [Nannocystaceae bacterium]